MPEPGFGAPEETRTPGLLLRRQLLYPAELQARMERVMGIEPTQPAWKAGILPLNYTRIMTVALWRLMNFSIYPDVLSILRRLFL